MTSANLFMGIPIHDDDLLAVLCQYKKHSSQFFGLKYLQPEIAQRLGDQLIMKCAEIVSRFQDTVDPKVLISMLISMKEPIYCVIRGLNTQLAPGCFANRMKANHCETAGLTFKCPRCQSELRHCNWMCADLFCKNCGCEGEIKSLNGVLGPNRIRLGVRPGVEASVAKGTFFLVFSKSHPPQFFDSGMWNFNEGPQGELYLDMIKGVSVNVYLPSFDPSFFSMCLKEIFDFTMGLEDLPSREDLQCPPDFNRDEVSLDDFTRSTVLSLKKFREIGQIRNSQRETEKRRATSDSQWRRVPTETQGPPERRATSDSQWRRVPTETQGPTTGRMSWCR
jgi:hypothetical protein